MVARIEALAMAAPPAATLSMLLLLASLAFLPSIFGHDTNKLEVKWQHMAKSKVFVDIKEAISLPKGTSKGSVDTDFIIYTSGRKMMWETELPSRALVENGQDIDYSPAANRADYSPVANPDPAPAPP